MHDLNCMTSLYDLHYMTYIVWHIGYTENSIFYMKIKKLNNDSNVYRSIVYRYIVRDNGIPLTLQLLSSPCTSARLTIQYIAYGRDALFISRDIYVT